MSTTSVYYFSTIHVYYINTICVYYFNTIRVYYFNTIRVYYFSTILVLFVCTTNSHLGVIEKGWVTERGRLQTNKQTDFSAPFIYSRTTVAFAYHSG